MFLNPPRFLNVRGAGFKFDSKFRENVNSKLLMNHDFSVKTTHTPTQ